MIGALWKSCIKVTSGALLLMAGMAGCLLPSREIVIPVRQIVDIQQNGFARALIIFLPGRGDTAEHFIENGFFKAVRERWHWLKAYVDRPEKRPGLYLLYGDHDKLSNAHDLLADILPVKNVYVIEGGHEWTAWGKLWTGLLETSPLP